MGIKYLWDTNTAIYYLQQLFPPGAEKFIDDVLKDNQPAISSVTEIELLCWKAAADKDIAVIQNFINDAVVFELEQPVKLKTAELRKAYKIKLPDAIIAATALTYDLILLSRNLSDFGSLSELKIINPWDK